MPRLFHVSSVLNRASIERHGLDWTRMGAARGIAGSSRPEVDGVFLCLSSFDVEFFLDMNNTGTAVDVWAVDGVSEAELAVSDNGFYYVPARIPADRLTLVAEAVSIGADRRRREHAAGPFRSTLRVQLDGGGVLPDDEVPGLASRIYLEEPPAESGQDT